MMRSSRQAMLCMISAFVVLLLLLATITCSDVVTDLSPCLQYLQRGSGMPPVPCCQRASALANSATTTADRQTACNCLKSAAKNLNINPQLAKDLPGNCKISWPYTISPNVDCSTIV